MRGAILRLLNGLYAYRIQAPTLSANQTLVLPAGTPVAGQVLQASNTTVDTGWAYLPTGLRQTVLSGRRDTGLENCPPNALTGSALTVTLNASSTDPFRFAIADGFNAYGPVDYVGQFTSNQTTTVSTNTTSFVYINRTSTGVLSLGVSTLTPVYSLAAPSSPSTDQHWFDLGLFQMKRWSGSAWVAQQRIFIGEVVSTASIQTTITYAYQGFYMSAWTSVSSSGAYVFSHNLGSLLSSGARVQVFSNASASDTGAFPAWVGDSSYGFYYANGASPNFRNQIETAWGTYVHLNAGSWLTSAYAKVVVQRGW